MPIWTAFSAASVRDETPILASTVETWWCTVRSEINSRREISRSRRPCESSVSTSCSAAVRSALHHKFRRKAPPENVVYLSLIGW